MPPNFYLCRLQGLDLLFRGAGQRQGWGLWTTAMTNKCRVTAVTRPSTGKNRDRGGLGGWPLGWDLCRPQLVSSDSLPRPEKGAGMWELDNICPESQKHPVSNSVSHRVTGYFSRTAALKKAAVLGWAGQLLKRKGRCCHFIEGGNGDPDGRREANGSG